MRLGDQMSITDAPIVSLDDARETKSLLLRTRARRIRAGHPAIGKEGRKAGRSATSAALDLGEINSAGWSHRFVIAVDPVV